MWLLLTFSRYFTHHNVELISLENIICQYLRQYANNKVNLSSLRAALNFKKELNASVLLF